MGTKNSHPVGFYSRSSTKSTVNHKHNNPQTLPPWWCRLPLIWHGIYGSARSDARNLFWRGRAGGWWKRIILLNYLSNKTKTSLVFYLWCNTMQRIRQWLRRPCHREDSTRGTSPDKAYQWLHAKPLDSAIGRVLAPYRPGGCHGHRRRRRVKTHTKHNF